MPCKNLDKALVFEKPGILSENLKTLTNSNYPTVQYFFCWNFAHVFYLPLSKKGVWDIFILFTSWDICKK